MKRIIPYLATALLCLTIGYLIGGFRATHQAAIGSNAGSLVWFTAIHERISKGDYDRAKEITEGAVDAHVAVISQVQREPKSVFAWMAPWTPDVVGLATPNPFRRAYEYFVEKTTLLKPETRDFLATTQTKQ